MYVHVDVCKHAERIFLQFTDKVMSNKKGKKACINIIHTYMYIQYKYVLSDHLISHTCTSSEQYMYVYVYSIIYR